jgi:hypothetical protein
MMRDILAEFGFCGYKSLYVSLVRIDNVKILSAFAGLGVILKGLIGLEEVSQIVLFSLILTELVIGVWASMKKKDRFRARRLQRFGLKVFIYFLLLLVLYTFQKQYIGRPEYYVYGALHSFVVFYITGVYLISVLENTSYILGGSRELNALLRVFKVRLKKAEKVIQLDSDFEDCAEVKKTVKRPKKHVS